MQAARWHGRGDVRVEEIPIPALEPNQALIEVEWCGICGTDLGEYRDGPIEIPTTERHPLTGRQAPMTLGHEIVGRVVKPARDGSGPSEGTRVIPDVVLGCGQCWWCRRHQEGICEHGAVVGLHTDGGLAEYVPSIAATCVPVPASLSAEAAALAEPTSVAVRAVRKIPHPVGASALVLGAGTIGLLVVQVLRACAASKIVVVDPKAGRRQLALDLGADAVLGPDELCEGPSAARIGPDVVLECSGVPGLARQAIRRTRRGGTTILVGTHGQEEPFDLLDTVLGEKRIVGSAAHLWDEDVATAVNLLARGKIDAYALISARIPLTKIVEAGFGELENPASEALKILVAPNQKVNK
jgi:2-desacetyl-2-hydroxyethyl bacteriochlorophyllide A dehydrogenase